MGTYRAPPDLLAGFKEASLRHGKGGDWRGGYQGREGRRKGENGRTNGEVAPPFPQILC